MISLAISKTETFGAQKKNNEPKKSSNNIRESESSITVEMEMHDVKKTARKSCSFKCVARCKQIEKNNYVNKIYI